MKVYMLSISLKFVKSVLISFLFIAQFGVVQATFFISAKENCGYGSNTYTYDIGPNVLWPDIKVQVGTNVLWPDIKIKLVDDPSEANLILIDEKHLNHSLKNAVDMNVCKKSLYAGKKIQVGPNVLWPDIKVQVGNNVLWPDYKLFYLSDSFSIEEAAGLFPAIWELNKK
tara:strand:+ start:177 stop:686 length:510 start_codon:yes stop_codon:yes gene_type:complete